MRFVLIVMVVLCRIVVAQAESVPSVADARAELERMLVTDQRHRNELAELSQEKGVNHPEVKALWDKQIEVDKRTLSVLETIVTTHGWPKLSVFGRDAATAAFLTVQHAELPYQLKYLPFLREAAEVGEASRGDLTLLIDRTRVGQGKPQLYGSQLRQALDGTLELYPVEDKANVGARRAEMGLEPLEDYLAYFNLDYKRP